MKRAIIWFRSDQRLTDNETFHVACTENDEVLPIFIWDQRWEETGMFNFSSLGEFRRQFMIESLNHLRQELQLLGSNLVEYSGNPIDILEQVCKIYNTKSIYASSSNAHYEQQDELRLKETGIQLHLFETSTLVHPADLPMPIEKLPDVFTSFRHKVEKPMRVRAVFPKPSAVVTPSIEGEIINRPLNPITKEMHDPRAAMLFSGGSAAAWERIGDYFWTKRALSVYKETRNGLVGADYSSKLSPWLSLGNISAKSVYWEVKRYESSHGSNESTYWLIFELLWRDYFQFVGRRYSKKLFLKNGIQGVSNKKTGFNSAAFVRWCGGTTGQDFVDANMRELNATGFMSNRGRQNVASYLCKDMGIDWRAGAAYFEHMLIDYDPCSNYANWQYIAGVGNDPRTDRHFNVAGQAERYDANGAYRRLWLD